MGQVVLNFTSVPGVDSVVLTNNGAPIDAPLPGGALTDHPLTAVDNQVFLAPRKTTRVVDTRMTCAGSPGGGRSVDALRVTESFGRQ